MMSRANNNYHPLKKIEKPENQTLGGVDGIAHENEHLHQNSYSVERTQVLNVLFFVNDESREQHIFTPTKKNRKTRKPNSGRG